MVHIRKKRRESVPVARPTHRGLRIAQSCLNEQRRSPTPICIYTSHYPMRKCTGTMRVCIKHTHRASTVAMSLTGLEVCEVSMRRRTKRQVNAFFIYAVPRYSHLRRGFRMDTHDKYTENNPTIWNFLSRKFSYPIKILYYSILQTTKEYKIIHRRTVNQSQANEKSFA